MRIVKESLDKMQNISGPQKKFMQEILPCFLSFQGKANFTNLSRYSAYDERTLRRNYLKPFNFSEFNLLLMKSESFQPILLAGDASFIPKSGKKTEGLAHFYNGSMNRSEKGLELSVLAIIDEHKEIYALDAAQTHVDENESRLDFYLKQIQRTREDCPDTVKWSVFDGYYAKVNFIDGICALGLNLISKLRVDANLKYLYDGPQNPGPGRRKEYDGKVDFNDLSRFDFEGELVDGSKVYSQLLWHVQFRRVLKVVTVVKETKGKRSHNNFFSTDLELQAPDLLRYYSYRFQIEYFFRDGKQFAGLNDCQSRKKEAIEFHFNLSMTAINLARIENKSMGRESFSMQSIKSRHYNERLLKTFLFNSALKLSSPKIQMALDKARNYGAIAS
jgi:hypothetical protein